MRECEALLELVYGGIYGGIAAAARNSAGNCVFSATKYNSKQIQQYSPYSNRLKAITYSKETLQ